MTSLSIGYGFAQLWLWGQDHLRSRDECVEKQKKRGGIGDVFKWHTLSDFPKDSINDLGQKYDPI